jgi:hypothetical protein
MGTKVKFHTSFLTSPHSLPFFLLPKDGFGLPLSFYPSTLSFQTNIVFVYFSTLTQPPNLLEDLSDSSFEMLTMVKKVLEHMPITKRSIILVIEQI